MEKKELELFVSHFASVASKDALKGPNMRTHAKLAAFDRKIGALELSKSHAIPRNGCKVCCVKLRSANAAFSIHTAPKTSAIAAPAAPPQPGPTQPCPASGTVPQVARFQPAALAVSASVARDTVAAAAGRAPSAAACGPVALVAACGPVALVADPGTATSLPTLTTPNHPARSTLDGKRKNDADVSLH